MAFNHLFASLRKTGRNAVLPVKQIKTICRQSLAKQKVETVLDFGAGTLFWTDWFVQEFESKVYAVDVYYDPTNMPNKKNVVFYSDVLACLRDNAPVSLVWACDVLHHLPPEFSDDLLNKICPATDMLIIKDIDANHKFGNRMNKVHDRVINGEKIHDIDPRKIASVLEARGFETSCYFVSKLWYPHFILVAVRKERL